MTKELFLTKKNKLYSNYSVFILRNYLFSLTGLKTYQKINIDDVHYRISRLEDIYTSRKGNPDSPHRHNFYTVLLVKKAKGKHIIDFKEYDLMDNRVFFVNPEQVHQVIEDDISIGYAILFSEEFLIKNNISTCFIDDINLFNEYGNSPPLNVNKKEKEKLSVYAEEMLNAYQSDKRFRESVFSANLMLFLIQCNTFCSFQNDNTQTIEVGNTILRKFKKLVDGNYKQWHSVKGYAQQLNVTSDHLNRVIKSLTGKTAKEQLQAKIITESKRMLYFSDLNAKQIAYELGFSEPANFSAFFKKNTGISPSEFKKRP